MEQLSIFSDGRKMTPLADRLRPKEFSAYIGQEHLLGEGRILRRLIEKDQITSMIFWGPPGVGKTTLASIIAQKTRAEFINFSAVTSGIKEIKEVMKRAEELRQIGRRTILFVDEIHRFNKSQQDAFLPFVEKGSIILIGATTENPSFEINAALLSRCKVFVLKQLEAVDIEKILENAIYSKLGFGNLNIDIDRNLLVFISKFSNGDVRRALGILEMAIDNADVEDGKVSVTKELVEECIGRRLSLYDKDGEEHYNLISALHKSIRNSDADAAIYWLVRMLDSGEEPLYIARRLVRFASEDVGLADVNALSVAVSAYQATHFLGMPECSVNLIEAAVYLSLAPKSNAMEMAYFKAMEDIRRSPLEPVPKHLRNAPTELMKELEYGKGYEYAHNYAEKITKMRCLPESLAGARYYEPFGMGEEKGLKKRLEEIRRYKEEE